MLYGPERNRPFPTAYEVVHGMPCSCGAYRGRIFTRDGIHGMYECPIPETGPDLSTWETDGGARDVLPCAPGGP